MYTICELKFFLHLISVYAFYFPNFFSFIDHFLSADVNDRTSTFRSRKTLSFPFPSTLIFLHSMNIKCYRLKCWKSSAYCPF